MYRRDRRVLGFCCQVNGPVRPLELLRYLPDVVKRHQLRQSLSRLVEDGYLESYRTPNFTAYVATDKGHDECR